MDIICKYLASPQRERREKEEKKRLTKGGTEMIVRNIRRANGTPLVGHLKYIIII